MRVNRCKTIPLLLAAAALAAACASVPAGKEARPPLASPAEYLARGMAEVRAADTLRQAKSPQPMMGGVFARPADTERWSRHLDGAEADFRELLWRFPASPEAPEAQFMLGQINDHPYRNRFDRALSEYRATAERYPGTEAAGKAAKRIALIESYGH